MDPGVGSAGPDPPIIPDACLWLKFWHRGQDRISLFIIYNWPIFLMTRALHFATKLNSRDIKNCNYFWVPYYDNLCSHGSRYFPRQWRQPAYTDWEHVVVSVTEVIWHKIPHIRPWNIKPFARSTRGGFARPRLPEVSLTLHAPVSTYKFSTPISVHFLRGSVERIRFDKMKAFSH